MRDKLIGTVIAITTAVCIAVSVSGQKPKEEPHHEISFVYLGDAEDAQETDDIWLKIDYGTGQRLIRVNHLVGFSFFPKEDLVRNQVHYAGGTIETTATYEQLVEATAKADKYLRELKLPRPIKETEPND